MTNGVSNPPRGFFGNLGQIGLGVARTLAEPALMVRDVAVLAYDVRTGNNSELSSAMGRYALGEMSQGRSAASVSTELVTTTVVRGGAAIATGGASEAVIAGAGIAKTTYDAYEGRVSSDQALQSIGGNLTSLAMVGASRSSGLTRTSAPTSTPAPTAPRPAAPAPTAPRPAAPAPSAPRATAPSAPSPRPAAPAAPRPAPRDPRLADAVGEAMEAAAGTPPRLAQVRGPVREAIADANGHHASVSRLSPEAGQCVQAPSLVPGQPVHPALVRGGQPAPAQIPGATHGQSPNVGGIAAHNWVNLPKGAKADPTLARNLALETRAPPSGPRRGADSPVVNPGARTAPQNEPYFTPAEHGTLAPNMRSGGRTGRAPARDPDAVDPRTMSPEEVRARFRAASEGS